MQPRGSWVRIGQRIPQRNCSSFEAKLPVDELATPVVLLVEPHELALFESDPLLTKNILVQRSLKAELRLVRIGKQYPYLSFK